MKETHIWILLLITTLTSSAQEKIFLDTGKTYKIVNKYYANEIILKPDSTFIQRYYEFKDKGNFNNYQNLTPEVESTGTYSRSGKYYIFDQESPNDFVNEYFKLTDKKLIYFYPYKGKLKRGGKFKLITE
jgi:hypothetical protein